MAVMIRRSHKAIFILSGILVVSFYFYTNVYLVNNESRNIRKDIKSTDKLNNFDDEFNVWLIFTKVYLGSPLTYKFMALLDNLMVISSVPLNLNIIVDNSSKAMAENYILKQMQKSNKNISHTFYHITESARRVEDIVDIMSNIFSKPGT